MVDLPEFARSEGEARAEAIRGSHKEGESIVGPIKLVNNVPNSPSEYEIEDMEARALSKICDYEERTGYELVLRILTM